MATSTADHLCIIVHGLWGNPSHMDYLANTLKSHHDESKLIVHVAAKNSGNYTYDGIELCGERLAREIEDLVEEYHNSGVDIKKFSIVGYSLGGLVSRYVVGVLYSKGFFDKIKPINFTTFATPHLGVRTPKIGIHNKIWNVLGARTLSASGRQLFTIDKFRDTKRPLLSVLADKDLIFWKALSLFKNRVLYANIVNDRSTNWYTASISPCDQWVDLNLVEFKYLPGYDNVLLDSEAGVKLKPQVELSPDEQKQLAKKSGKTVGDFFRDLPFLALYTVLIPIGFTFFLINAGVQTYSSGRRIRLHNADKLYPIPLMAQEVQETMDSLMETVNHSESADHLADNADDKNYSSKSQSFGQSNGMPSSSSSSTSVEVKGESNNLNLPDFPTLALAPYQFDMIDDLDQLNFRKFPVHIHKVKHSHAAIIVRHPRNKNLDEGKMVIRHWLDEVFEL